MDVKNIKITKNIVVLGQKKSCFKIVNQNSRFCTQLMSKNQMTSLVDDEVNTKSNLIYNISNASKLNEEMLRTIVDLLMQLRATQDEKNVIVQNNTVIREQILGQLKNELIKAQEGLNKEQIQKLELISNNTFDENTLNELLKSLLEASKKKQNELKSRADVKPTKLTLKNFNNIEKIYEKYLKITNASKRYQKIIDDTVELVAYNKIFNKIKTKEKTKPKKELTKTSDVLNLKQKDILAKTQTTTKISKFRTLEDTKKIHEEQTITQFDLNPNLDKFSSKFYNMGGAQTQLKFASNILTKQSLSFDEPTINLINRLTINEEIKKQYDRLLLEQKQINHNKITYEIQKQKLFEEIEKHQQKNKLIKQEFNKTQKIKTDITKKVTRNKKTKTKTEENVNLNQTDETINEEIKKQYDRLLLEQKQINHNKITYEIQKQKLFEEIEKHQQKNKLIKQEFNKTQKIKTDITKKVTRNKKTKTKTEENVNLNQTDETINEISTEHKKNIKKRKDKISKKKKTKTQVFDVQNGIYNLETNSKNIIDLHFDKYLTANRFENLLSKRHNKVFTKAVTNVFAKNITKDKSFLHKTLVKNLDLVNYKTLNKTLSKKLVNKIKFTSTKTGEKYYNLTKNVLSYGKVSLIHKNNLTEQKNLLTQTKDTKIFNKKTLEILKNKNTYDKKITQNKFEINKKTIEKHKIQDTITNVQHNKIKTQNDLINAEIKKITKKTFDITQKTRQIDQTHKLIFWEKSQIIKNNLMNFVNKHKTENLKNLVDENFETIKTTHKKVYLNELSKNRFLFEKLFENDNKITNKKEIDLKTVKIIKSASTQKKEFINKLNAFLTKNELEVLQNKIKFKTVDLINKQNFVKTHEFFDDKIKKTKDYNKTKTLKFDIYKTLNKKITATDELNKINFNKKIVNIIKKPLKIAKSEMVEITPVNEIISPELDYFSDFVENIGTKRLILDKTSPSEHHKYREIRPKEKIHKKPAEIFKKLEETRHKADDKKNKNDEPSIKTIEKKAKDHKEKYAKSAQNRDERPRRELSERDVRRLIESYLDELDIEGISSGIINQIEKNMKLNKRINGII